MAKPRYGAEREPERGLPLVGGDLLVALPVLCRSSSPARERPSMTICEPPARPGALMTRSLNFGSRYRSKMSAGSITCMSQSTNRMPSSSHLSFRNPQGHRVPGAVKLSGAEYSVAAPMVAAGADFLLSPHAGDELPHVRDHRVRRQECFHVRVVRQRQRTMRWGRATHTASPAHGCARPSYPRTRTWAGSCSRCPRPGRPSPRFASC